MSQFSLNIFFGQMQRLSGQKVQGLLNKYEDDLKKLSLVDANQIFNFLDKKFETIERWHQGPGMVDILTFKRVATRIPELSRYVFEEIENMNNLHPTIQVEVAFLFDENERMNLLRNFGNKLSSIFVQELILALNNENQARMMVEYKKTILAGGLNLLLSFLGTLEISNQRKFLHIIKEEICNMETKDFIAIVLGIYSENIEYFFNEYCEIIDRFEDNDIIDFLSMLQGDGLILFSEMFKSRIANIPASALMYKLGTSIDDEKQLYKIWSNNQDKLSELSDNYFNLVVSRLDDESRLNSLTDFKERYNKMGVEELLDLFMFDKDEFKVKLFVEYQDRINTIDDKKFVKYINENINDASLRNKLFLLYKDKVCKMSDEDFIYFVSSYCEVNLKYVFGDLNETKKGLVDYIFANFNERLKSIGIESIPKLFEDSHACLQHKYLEILEENIKKLILDKTYIERLLRAVWGDSRNEILESFPVEFGSLTAEDWYGLQNVIGNQEYKSVEKYLISCQVDGFDFIDNEKLLSNSNLKRMFYYFEQNVQSKLLSLYTELAENKENDKLLAIYEDVMTKVIDEDTEYVLSSYSIMKLLVLLRVLLKYHIINDKDDYYLMFKELYFHKLISKLEMEKQENVNLVKDSLFYRLIKGSISSTSLMSIHTLKGLIFFSKNVISIGDRDNINVYAPAEIEKFVVNLNEEQVVSLNNKLFKQVCKYLFDNYKDDNPTREQVRNLAIRLYMSVGYNHSKRLIDLHVAFTRYEFIFNGINIKRIKMNENGEPAINKKLIDFMFGSNMNDDNTNINRLLQDKIPDFERKFAEIYNGWETIYQNLNGNVTVARVLKWFEDNKILLNPDEYRLAAVIGEIGNDEKNLLKARELYADMKQRKFSTIPKIMGSYNDEYTYEMLDLDDPLGLVVGYITRCCFLIDGASRTALFHSAQSKDGRIFIVRKNGELIAQSWVWRNGNLVCFDNVESRGSFDYNILLETYKKASKDIIAVSSKNESTKEQVKLVTFGGGYSKIAKPKEKVPTGKIHTPRVEKHVYSDAEYEQFILASNGESELYYGDVQANYVDARSNIARYSRLSLLEREDKSNIIKKIREIDYIKNGNIREIDFNAYKYAALADDWYLLLTNTGEVECVLLDTDERAREEIYTEIDNLPKIFSEMGIGDEAKSVGGKVLALVKGSDM